MPAMPSQDPASMAPASPEDQSAGQGFVIEIVCRSDGSFSVSSESVPEEAAEENATGDTDGGQPAGSFAEALSIAKQLYAAGGASDEGESDFASGYGQGNGSNIDMGQK